MRLTTKGRYGVRAVVNLASQAQEGPISISQIAREEELSPEFLEQIFFKLKKAGIIRSMRGPKGGFVLNHEPAEISVKTILDAVGESLYPTPCTNHDLKPCPRQSICALAPLWNSFYDTIREHLAGVTLKDIIEGEKRILTPSPNQA